MKLGLLALASLLFVGFAVAGTWVEDDTVIIDPYTAQGSSRLKREETAQELRVDEEDTVLIKSSSCVTTKGRTGQCMSLRECFPLLFPIDPTVEMPSGVTLSDPLADQLIASSGFCGGGEYRSDSPSLFAQVVRAEVLVCCAMQSRIPPPLPPPQMNATLQNINPSRASCGNIKIDPKLLPQGLDGNDEKIVNGRPAQRALMSSNKQFCGGSLIDSSTILTAAHCVQHMGADEASKLTIQIGDHHIYSTSDGTHEIRTVSRILYHRGFSMQHLHHDVAVLHLARPVSNTKYIQPVCLHPGTPSYDNVYGDVAGWGQLRDNGPQPSTLQTASVKVWTHDECSQKYSGHAPAGIGEGMLCAGGSGKDSCRGDSGGPLTINSRSQAQEVGIVSFGVGCGSFPGVYTRVSRYVDWINKNRKRSLHD
ncbi:Chymotrypsin-like elastase family member 2A [Orchesella cincta]|uniref:Chymotrypsin-like elastase family member 2A n=1 Tax=Orchesella cincta TaxID=48709 RepID=A0A1D2MHM5_ORCCI|nr:Chymotrypsin-like elastase family member 2A [Orchesella cincta]